MYGNQLHCNEAPLWRKYFSSSLMGYRETRWPMDREVLGSSPGRAIALCSWARNFTVPVPLSTQEYKWVPANCQGNQTKCWEVTYRVLDHNSVNYLSKRTSKTVLHRTILTPSPLLYDLHLDSDYLCVFFLLSAGTVPGSYRKDDS